jgi:cyclopropane-fatty-acyl-phospholipid synthase
VALAELLRQLVGDNPPIAFRLYDGSRLGPDYAPATIVVRSPDALRRMVQAPNDLGLGRAYVAGDIDLEGDVFEALSLREQIPSFRLGPRQIAAGLRLVGVRGLRKVPPPPEEVKLSGRRHSKARDAAAVSHHYDVSNEFYRIVLGPSLTYSCAVWSSPDITLEDAQAAKHELICQKLALEPGMRLLDIGCGWGGMLLHAAQHHGVRAVGVTISKKQVELTEKRIAEAGLSDRVEVRLQDYRDVDDGPYDAISSIGMFEHVGLSQLATYFDGCARLLRPGGRLLNHQIGRPAVGPGSSAGTKFAKRGFVDAYVFPDGELHEVGGVVTALQESGFEVRHLESLREHYALTLRRWVANLERDWETAVRASSEGRARVWRLYMAGSALGFEDGRIQVHQVLAVKPDHGLSGMPLRPRFE